MIKGIYLSSPLTEEKNLQISELGVNLISLPWEHCDDERVGSLRSNGVKVFVEISLFVGNEIWQKYPDSRPVDRNGQAMEATDWYYGVCPNHPKVREMKLEIINQLIETYEIDGLWLDFIRYPCRWEKVRSPQIIEYCFCKNCQDKFKQDMGGKPEGERWIAWKCRQITEFVVAVRNVIERSNKAIRLGLFAVPWDDEAFGCAIRSIICQDFRGLSDMVDVFGVMAYHKLTEHPVGWIGDLVQTLKLTTGKTILPLIQSMDEPVKISRSEFEQAIAAAKRKPSDGVMVFNFDDLLLDEDKYHVFKHIGV